MMKYIKLLFILLKHGINPFSKFGKNAYKLNRLTNKDKIWIINNFNSYAKLKNLIEKGEKHE